MTQEFMKSNLNLKAGHLVFLQDVIIGIADEGVLLGASIAGTENVAQTDVLETLVLSDFIIVGDVDASRHTRASKGEDIKACEVWSQELVLFEFFRPGQHRQHLFC